MLRLDGDYVVSSPYWDDGATPDVGAVTRSEANTPVTGVVDSANSLIGAAAQDRAGERVIARANGAYLVSVERNELP